MQYRRLPLLIACFLSFISCKNDEPPPVTDSRAYAGTDYTNLDVPDRTVDFNLIDIADSARLSFTHKNGAFGKKWMPETMGSGGGFFDYNGDNRPDILLVNGREWPGHERAPQPATPALFENVDGRTFRDVTRQTGLAFSLYGMGCAFADYDADGDIDIYLTAVGTNKLLRNQGGRFRDVTSITGATGNAPEADVQPAWSTGAAWLDYDRDGWLDLFVCNYVKWTPETDIFTTLDGKTKSYATPQQYQGETCRLYRNLYGQQFEDVTREAGIYNPDGKSLGVAVADFNQDGWPDLVVANDTQPNFLYINNGNGTFREVGLQAGVAYDEIGRTRAGMGIDVAPVLDEDILSIVIGNFSREPLSLYTQLDASDTPLFQDRAGVARLTKSSLLYLTFGVLFSDLDLDGHLDLLVANGHIEPEINAVQRDITFKQPPQVFRNTGNGRFVEVTDLMHSSFQEPTVGRGLAVADIDDDGDWDVLLTVNGGRPKLFRNDLNVEANWVKLKVIGKQPNHQAIGAHIALWAGGRRQQAMIRTGSSYLSQSDTGTILFGLGQATQVDSLEIHWPTSGAVQKLGPLPAQTTHVIRE